MAEKVVCLRCGSDWFQGSEYNPRTGHAYVHCRCGFGWERMLFRPAGWEGPMGYRGEGLEGWQMPFGLLPVFQEEDAP